ncbi:MAG: ATP-binding cassette domain-containing protein [Actinomycetota bacterium]|nr:ATP-binding cassette domain-containing protein [Actinomycetota bacterium]
MIRFADVSFTYAGAEEATLRRVDLHVEEGELCLVVGETGSGKTTLLRAVNGLVPHFTGGHLSGEVTVAGRSTRDHPPRELADVVGMVGQDPAASFVTDVVEDELAYTMENLGIAPDVMRRRVEDVLDLLGLHDLRHRPLATLSGGQQQRVAIGAVLTASPRVLVLDEPTSALDPAAAEEVLSSLARLVHDVGLTVVLAEHRLERVLPFADRVVLVPGRGEPLEVGPTAEIMATSPVAPPIVELARLAGWRPIPLSVRDARRMAGPLREALAAATPAGPGRGEAAGPGRESEVGSGEPAGPGGPMAHPAEAITLATVEKLTVAYGPVVALDRIDLTVQSGEVLAVMGRNGSGKSTLLGQLAGLRAPTGGRVRVGGGAPADLAPRELIRRVGLVPQDAGMLLYGETVAGECATADRETGLDPGTTAAVLDRILPGMPTDRHPRDLSEGQRLALALAVVMAPAPALVLLDEPTRGLDYPSKARLVEVLDDLVTAGHGVVMTTHDVELVARAAGRAVVLAEGEVVSDGPARDVVCHSPVFAPQVAKVLAPEPWLTVSEVERALAGVVP